MSCIFDVHGQETEWMEAPSAGTGDWSSVAMSPDGLHQIAGDYYGEKIYISSNAGTTWTLSVEVGALVSGVATSSDGVKMTATTNSDIWTSSDSGDSWEPVPGTSDMWWGVVMSTNGQTQLAKKYFGDVHISSDSGATWSYSVSGGAEIRGIAMSSSGIVQTVVGTTIDISSDAGATWTSSNAPSKTWLNVAMSADGALQTAVANDNTLWTSADSGVAWTEVSTTATDVFKSLSMSTSGEFQTAVNMMGRSIWASVDYGATWEQDTAIGDKHWTAVAMGTSTDELTQYTTATVFGGGIWIGTSTSTRSPSSVPTKMPTSPSSVPTNMPTNPIAPDDDTMDYVGIIAGSIAGIVVVSIGAYVHCSKTKTHTVAESAAVIEMP